ncbi:putative galactinol--sucrose galactosyltransferase 4 [Hibiscus syriacus]|uniref:Galactinol--sucrose galactosyltransferase 4 n=1 Tax=Hibiscus syriacus TaxID=106335 RepID=A0A6A3AIE2_HIBSY|nr:stachyose synthase-like [Hibiscus syriacus]KAE8703573.1 putative galactinol--sucrose galactosyltransferase 4 [Hibiscus syriacus]
MAPPNNPVSSTTNLPRSSSLEKCFDLCDGKLSVNGFPLLHDVPTNVTFTPFSSVCNALESDAPIPLVQRVQVMAQRGGFLGFTNDEPSDSMLNSLGKFTDRDFLSVFRFKTWWSTQWVGTSGSDLQMETQWVVLDIPEIKSYAMIIPIIEGGFRSALRPGKDGHVMIFAESGSSQVKLCFFNSIAYVHVSDNPFNLMKEAFSAIRVHLNTFKLLEEKSLPSIVDKFGWCTWDAFYLTVEPAGVWQGVKEFVDAGVQPRFIIIDDGWQSINNDTDDPNQDAKNLVLGGEQMTARLYRFEEGEKFRKYKGGSFLGPNAFSYNPHKSKMLITKAIEVEHAVKAHDKALQSSATDVSEIEAAINKLKQELDDMFKGEGSSLLNGNHESSGCNADDYGMKAFTKDLRTQFKGLDDIWVWHALCGAWGGVRPGATHLDCKIVPCHVSLGLAGTMPDLAVDKIVEGGIGLVHPSQADDFYDSMHSHLAKSGITGVKVDVIHTLEYVSEEYGGRVNLAKAYYNGLSKSLSKNFKGTGIISSMQQCNDFFFLGTKQISMGRVGDDFWFQDPNGDPNGVFWLQGVHMVHCAYNSLWMGEIIQPDWDMFQSDHVCAKYHAGSRAICGGPVYISDSLGGHDFDLIKKLVYPDGTIPRCKRFALPTRDSLFVNPLFDNKSLLKLWNFNKYGGVVAAFNCQGAGWDGNLRRIIGYPQCYKPISGSVHVTDIEWDQCKEAAAMGEAEEYVVYLDQTETILLVTPKSDPIQVTVQPSSFEIFSFVPLKNLGPTAKFSPIGLTNMFNSGGTIQEVDYNEAGAAPAARIKIKGGGNFLAYSNVAPKTCFVNGAEAAPVWSADGKLKLDLPWIEEADGISYVNFFF